MNEIKKDQTQKLVGCDTIGGATEPNFGCAVECPTVKSIIQSKIRQHNLIAGDLEVLYKMLPTELTHEQSCALHRIMSTINL